MGHGPAYAALMMTALVLLVAGAAGVLVIPVILRTLRGSGRTEERPLLVTVGIIFLAAVAVLIAAGLFHRESPTGQQMKQLEKAVKEY